MVALLVAGCTRSGTYSKYGVAKFQGDGIIRDVSRKGGPFSSHGFVIELDKFDLGDIFDKQFRLRNVPTIASTPVEICLAVEDKELARFSVASVDDLRKKLQATLTVSLRDSKDYRTTGFSANIGNLVWSTPVHGYTGFWLYTQSGSFFTPRSEETYSLHVQYSPDPTLRGKQGRVYLYSGYGGS
jgi:hypothetical protein